MRWRALTAIIASAAILAGCGSPPSAPVGRDLPPRADLSPDFPGAPELPPADLTDTGPGSLVEAKPVTGIVAFDDANATAVKVTYRSTGGDGAPTLGSGVVVVPAGAPPKEGWPIITVGHAMSGTQPKCGPTLADEYGGYSTSIVNLMNRGFVVAFPDFPGLGLDGQPPHSIVDAATLGNDMIDVARAAHRVLPSSSTQWAAYGLGEGGLAAWAAAERAGLYGGGMSLVGAVALSPFADMSPLVDAAQRGELNGPVDIRTYVWTLQSLANTDPGFDLDLYRSGVARDQWAVLADCASADPEEAKRLLDEMNPDDLKPRDDAAADDARQRLLAAGVPARYPTPGAAPVLVTYGTLDATSPAEGIRAAVDAACAKGEQIEVMTRAGATEASNDQVVESAIGWLFARFAGERLSNVCIGAP
ncbi:putative lipase [Mycobacterium antarcticum]|uniref:lipase family protein n=1 Tax=unclassified Mycolicibacterium TaxID=2636767 RepID=UPI0023A1279A|nr:MULTISPECIES: lipase family protein [unclassified Mycolicibacterium]BDX33868.1 putative lipase [Mycolicibacterium sp. TUM20985]GLP77042.1 putative lipase [Mycolicibacterium sp. TUM20983]